MEKACIFCRVANHEIPSKTIFEDDLVRAFMDIDPVSKGHVLVIPKKHYENIFTTPDLVLERINIVCKEVALRCKKALGATGVNILNASGKDAQQSVFHLHYHIVPRYPDDGLDMWFHPEAKVNANIEDVYERLMKKE